MDTFNQEASLVRKEQLYLQYNLFKANALGGIFAAAILSLLSWNYINHQTIFIWFFITCAMIAVRLYFYFALFREQPSQEHMEKWETIHTIMSTAIGLAWGSAGIFLFPEHNLEHQAMLIIILLGVTATAGMTFIDNASAGLYLYPLNHHPHHNTLGTGDDPSNPIFGIIKCSIHMAALKKH
ncbi:MAG: hypothetical protein Q9N62_07300 [Ghiorsea sp.]|nr:hypothetical protein [Ghiorsea sp.]